MENLSKLFDRINELQQIIDLESDSCSEWSNRLVQNAQMEIDLLHETIEQLATADCLVL